MDWANSKNSECPVVRVFNQKPNDHITDNSTLKMGFKESRMWISVRIF